MLEHWYSSLISCKEIDAFQQFTIPRTTLVEFSPFCLESERVVVRLNRLVWISYCLPCSAQLQVLEKELESRLQVSVCFRFWIELGILLDSLSVPCARCGVNSVGVFRPSSLLSIVVDTMNLNL